MVARNWKDVRAEAIATGQIDEARVAEGTAKLREAHRAYRLAEIRKAQRMTQAQVAEGMHVAQPRVSAIERGELSSTEFGTLSAYVQALGGRLRMVAEFGDESIVVRD
jgi:predicted XRE-type DNA-binding protein